MDARGRRVEALRVVSALALIVGLLLTAVSLFATTAPVRALFVAGLLVIIGVGLRLEAAITESR